MNYSKDSRSKKMKDSNKNTKKKKTKKAKVTTFRVIVIAIIIGLFAIVGSGLGILFGVIKSAPDISTLELKPTTDYTSFVYDENGAEIDRLSSGENRIYVKLDQIPKHLQNAVVAIEDARFWEHNGIDLIGIMRAIVTNLKAGEIVEGASTITQQVIKNNALTSEQTFVRKIQEQYLALQFDKIYDKELILEYYLNTMPLGHGTNGVQAAAHRYFGKDVSELTLAESVVIAGITQAPTRYSPVRNPQNNFEKSKVILAYMVEQGYITEEERQAALTEDPYKNVQEVNKQYEEVSSRTYFVDAVIDQVINDLQTKKGMTVTEANKLLFGGGVEIYTTLDQNMQKIVDEKMADDSLFPSYKEYVINYSATIKKADGTSVNKWAEGVIKSDDADTIDTFKKAKQAEWGVTESDEIAEVVQLIPQAQAAIVISDQFNGHVKALSGGRGEKYGDRTFNRATQAKRQPGSTFKILASYAPTLDTGVLSPGSIIMDEPYTVGNYSPKNWRSYYKGPTTVREGIWDSMNILAVKAMNMVGIDTAYNYLLNFGFTTLSDQDKVYSLPLGGLTDGVTPLELNAAYAAIANQGTYTKPILYTQVLDRDKQVILDNSVPETHTVIKASTASMLTDMMEDVITIGTGGKASIGKIPVAGKTGTTSDNKDFLFAGYTPYYTATVWMGYDRPKSFNARSEHLKLWSSIMSEIHSDLPNKDFELVTTGYTKTSICADSGKLPTELCKLAPDHKIVSDYFQKNHAPSEYCDVHVEEKVCTVSGKIATEFCPPETVQTRVVTRTSGGEIKPEDLCDVHTENTPTETPTFPEWPWQGEGEGQTPEETPGEAPGDIIDTPEETPSTPVQPNPDDNSGFFIPQG